MPFALKCHNLGVFLDLLGKPSGLAAHEVRIGAEDGSTAPDGRPWFLCGAHDWVLSVGIRPDKPQTPEMRA